MRPFARRSVADAFASKPSAGGGDSTLENGSRVAVVGGGPAGSFFAYFLLKMADAVDLHLEVDIFEPRFFSRCGPGGCNHCGGIVSESLVQILATEGINLPSEVVQRGIDSYVVHMDVGSVRIASPVGEQRIAALYRGNGPRDGGSSQWRSFDDYLQEMAVERGARVVRKLVVGLERQDGRPALIGSDGARHRYDLVAVASGVNSNLLKRLHSDLPDIEAPRTTRTYICEFRVGRSGVREILGDSMHVFLLDLPRLEFAALIPKGEYVTMCMLGDDLDQELVDAFLDDPVVRRCFPTDVKPVVCSCSPLINLGANGKAWGERLVLIGDSGVTRLYKDGIGAAFRTSKAAATTAVFQGISERAFERHYGPACRAITRDNAIGRVIFAGTTLFKRSRLSRRAILRMTSLEQQGDGVTRPMSSVLWNMFTGSAPYQEILTSSLRPGFLVGLLWNVAHGIQSAGGGGEVA